MKRRMAALALIAWLGLHATVGGHGDEPSRIVSVTGRVAGSMPAAAEEAKLDVLREAVRQVCGSFINAHAKQRKDNPRCVVIILQDDDVDDDKPPEAGGSVQTTIEDFFLSQKVRLMDKQTSDAVRTRDLEAAAQSGDARKAAAAGAAFKADVVVMGKAEAKHGAPVNAGDHRVERWGVTLAARMVQADSAAVIWSRTYRPEKPYASTVDTGQAALVGLAEEIAPRLLRDIGEAWRDRATAGRTIQVTIEPCTRWQFRAIQAEMIEHKGITGGEDGFKLRELGNEVATVDVNWKYNRDQLADRLEELDVVVNGVPIKLDVVEQSAKRITARLRPAVTAPIFPAAPAASEPGH